MIGRSGRTRRAGLSALAGLVLLAGASLAQEAGEASADEAARPERQARLRLLEAVAAALGERERAFEELRTPEQIEAWTQHRREHLRRALGDFPPRTPLNARVTGRIEHPRFRMEKVLFESRPGVWVSANLYLPRVDAAVPGVLVPCGHSQNGKAEAKYQLASMSLACHGMAALCFDPIGQGERKQVLNAQGAGAHHATLEHMLLGAGCVLLGENLASWMVWDGMRALDYLASRPEVDGERLGCTGNSGGGTQTSYLMAIDPRIDVAAPSCYLTGLGALLPAIGAQDAEQVLFGQVAAGLDHADYLHLRAPKPTLLCTATEDFFPIEGSWECFREAKRLWTRMGRSHQVDLVEVGQKHGFHRPLREAMVQWMQRWLLGRDEAVEEPELTPFTEAELRCTATGQVVQEAGARTIFEVQREQAEGLAARRGTPRGAELRRRVRQVLGVGEVAPRQARVIGVFQHADVDVQRWCLVADDPLAVPLPALFLEGGAPDGAVTLVLHDRGKGHDLDTLVALARDGGPVLAVDLRGVGELRPRGDRGDYATVAGDSWGDVMIASLLGRSWLGLRVEEVLGVVGWLRTTAPGGARERPIELRAHGALGSAALHAAVLQPEAFGAVRLDRALISWDGALGIEQPVGLWEEVAHDALRSYDLPDLRAELGAKRHETAPRRAGQ